LDTKESRSPEILKEKCPECQSTNLIRDDEQGEVVCGDCGYVLQEQEVDRRAGWQAFDRTEYDRRAHAEIYKGLPTYIGPDFNARGRFVSPSFQTRRLKKWQSRSAMQESAERNLQIATQELNRLSDVLNIPKAVKEETMMLYRKVLKMGSVRGRSINGIVAAVLYAACRKYQIPISLPAISKQSQTNKKEMARNYRLLIRDLNLRQPITNYSIYIIKVAGNLGLSITTQEKAFNILKEAKKKGLTDGKSPQGLAATALYIACVQEKKDDKKILVTQEQLAQASGVTEVTIRNRCKDLKDKLGLSH